MSGASSTTVNFEVRKHADGNGPSKILTRGSGDPDRRRREGYRSFRWIHGALEQGELWIWLLSTTLRP